MARKAGISRSDVLDAAIEVADADGLGGLTLAAVASRLGIRTPSLYAHIDGIAGLKRLMAVEGAALLGTALEDGAAGALGADALAAFMRAYRGFAHRNPGLYEASQSDAPHPDDDPAHAAALEGPVRVGDVTQGPSLADLDADRPGPQDLPECVRGGLELVVGRDVVEQPWPREV